MHRKLLDGSDIAPVLKLSELGKLYSSRFKDIEMEDEGCLHTTHLKVRLLSYFPDMRAHSHGREVLLMFHKDIGLAIQKAYDGDFDSEAMNIARAAKIIHRDLFKIKIVSMELLLQHSRMNVYHHRYWN